MAPFSWLLIDLLFLFSLKEDVKAPLQTILRHFLLSAGPLVVALVAVIGAAVLDDPFKVLFPFLVLLTIRLAEFADNCFFLETVFAFFELAFLATTSSSLGIAAVLLCDVLGDLHFRRNLRRQQREAIVPMRLEAHVAHVVAPCLFAAAVSIILYSGNRRRYYHYDCGPKFHILLSTLIPTALKLGWTLLLVTGDLVTLAYQKNSPAEGLSPLLRRIFDDDHRRGVACTLAVIGLVFSSSWLLVPNGLRLLSRLSAGC